jgi:hypothetical protein
MMRDKNDSRGHGATRKQAYWDIRRPWQGGMRLAMMLFIE